MAQCAVSKSIIMAIEAYVKLFWGLVGGVMKLATPGGGWVRICSTQHIA